MDTRTSPPKSFSNITNPFSIAVPPPQLPSRNFKSPAVEPKISNASDLFIRPPARSLSDEDSELPQKADSK